MFRARRLGLLALALLLTVPALPLSSGDPLRGLPVEEIAPEGAIPLGGDLACDAALAHEGAEAVQLLAAAVPVLPTTPQEEAPIVPATMCTGIRPGQRMTSPAGCTYNFIFRDQTQRLYIGVAGHCVSRVGQRVSTGALGEIGTVVFTHNNGVGDDFALIRIDPALYDKVNPAMCHWSGPTGVFTGRGGHLVHHYGNGMVYGAIFAVRPRTGYAASWSVSSFGAYGLVNPGDSGSPARLDDGPAVGIITHGIPGGGLFYGTRVQHAIDMVRAETGLRIEVVTSSTD